VTVAITDYLPGLGNRGTRRADVTEARGPVVAQSPARNVTRDGITDGIPPGGIDDVQAGIGAATQMDRTSLMEELCEGYLMSARRRGPACTTLPTRSPGGVETSWTGAAAEDLAQLLPLPDSVPTCPRSSPHAG
jgi:hypothetical protein